MIWEKRADIVSYLGMAFVAGWISCQGYYGLTQLWTQKAQLAQTAAQAICDRGKARDLAGQLEASTTGAVSDTAVVGGLTGCKKVSPEKVPQVAKILSEPKK